MFYNKGYHRIGSGAKNEMVMAHLDYLRELEMSGRIEEMLVHEAGNACLNHHQKVVFVSSYRLSVVV